MKASVGAALALIVGVVAVSGASAERMTKGYSDCGQVTVDTNQTRILKVKGMGCRGARKIAAEFEDREAYTIGDRERIKRFVCKRLGYYDPFEIAYKCRHTRQAGKAFKAFWPPETEEGKGTVRAKVLCWNNNFPEGGPADVRSAPRRCSLYRNGYDYEAAGAVHMRKLKWKHWGAPKATGKGEFAQPMDQRDPWKPIRVKLRQPVERCGRTVYSRATFRVPGTHGRLGFPIWTC